MTCDHCGKKATAKITGFDEFGRKKPAQEACGAHRQSIINRLVLKGAVRFDIKEL